MPGGHTETLGPSGYPWAQGLQLPIATPLLPVASQVMMPCACPTSAFHAGGSLLQLSYLSEVSLNQDNTLPGSRQCACLVS